ncbi:histidine ammonia-lyase [Herbaspirillum seropedicae]|uniref:HAL/PAL/TAL family ammonia-lyase n=1 Tax=Herbaspirillum seropedicae TaxID=964 RepID=UPI00339A61E5
MPHTDLTSSASSTPIRFGAQPLAIEDVVALARRERSAQLHDAPDFRARIARGADFLDRLLREDGTIYGVTTGYGDSCTVTVPPELVPELPHHLYTYHGCGLGALFTPEQARAILAARLNSLCQGFSGVSVALLEQITGLLQHDLLPQIPCEGSVGASGDLTPLSYLAAVLCGERDVWREGATVPAAQALAAAGMTPLRLRPKEGLAIMNGTAVMTALACLAFDRARYLCQLATRITAMSSFTLDGNAHHFDATLFSAKPHPGQQQVAAWLQRDLPCGQAHRNEKRLQDRYSVRCAPHVIGVLNDALPSLRQFIENELNSANDNPLIDPDGERVLHGGHFYGGHIAFAMDSMKTAVANIADLLDRQMALMVDQRYNNGLPANLSGAQGTRAPINHGLKALQISASAWTAEALKLTMPASVFSRSTECHNQDKVSMGTIAARDCLRVLELTEQVAAALLITVRQGVWLRSQRQQVGDTPLQDLPAGRLAAMQAALSEDIAVVAEDRMLEPDLRLLLQRIRAQAWSLYD